MKRLIEDPEAIAVLLHYVCECFAGAILQFRAHNSSTLLWYWQYTEQYSICDCAEAALGHRRAGVAGAAGRTAAERGGGAPACAGRVRAPAAGGLDVVGVRGPPRAPAALLCLLLVRRAQQRGARLASHDYAYAQFQLQLRSGARGRRCRRRQPVGVARERIARHVARTEPQRAARAHPAAREARALLTDVA